MIALLLGIVLPLLFGLVMYTARALYQERARARRALSKMQRERAHRKRTEEAMRRFEHEVYRDLLHAYHQCQHQRRTPTPRVPNDVKIPSRWTERVQPPEGPVDAHGSQYHEVEMHRTNRFVVGRQVVVEDVHQSRANIHDGRVQSLTNDLAHKIGHTMLERGMVRIDTHEEYDPHLRTLIVEGYGFVVAPNEDAPENQLSESLRFLLPRL